MTYQWTPDQQEMVEFFAGRDRVANAMTLVMSHDGLRLTTIKSLLPIAELAWRNKETWWEASGALLFLDIETPSPRVEFLSKANGVKLQLLKLSPSRYVLPLLEIINIATHDSRMRS